MKEFFYERIGEEVCRGGLANGLEVCVVPKPGYAKKYAFFSTRYGGMDTRFRLDGKWLDTRRASPTIWSIRCSIRGRATPYRNWRRTARSRMPLPPTP